MRFCHRGTYSARCPQSFRVPRHFKRNVKAFFHAELFHGVGEFFGAHVESERCSHFARELETIWIDVSNDDMTRSSLFADRQSHATNRAGARNEHIFADEIERERSVHSITERIETGKNVKRDGWIRVPAI